MVTMLPSTPNCETKIQLLEAYFIKIKRSKHASYPPYTIILISPCRGEYVASLKSLHAAGTALERRPGLPFEIPVELLRYVDDGGNPDAFIIDVVRSAAVANEAAKGKVDAFR